MPAKFFVKLHVDTSTKILRQAQRKINTRQMMLKFILCEIQLRNVLKIILS